MDFRIVAFILIAMLPVQGFALFGSFKFPYYVYDSTRHLEQKKQYNVQSNAFNLIANQNTRQSEQLQMLRLIAEAVGDKANSNINVNVELRNNSADNKALRKAFDEDPNNKALVDAFEALERNQLQNKYFLAKVKSNAAIANRPLSLNERYAITQEMKTMSNEILLQELMQLESITSSRAILSQETSEAMQERLKLKIMKERIQRLNNQ